MYPDDVVSARHFDQLGEDLVARHWTVSAYPSMRSCRNRSQYFKKNSIHNQIKYKRVWRPDFDQKSNFGRLANTFFMLIGWSFMIITGQFKAAHAVIIGTDPIFANLISIPLKYRYPNLRIIHWCFDLHPDASSVSNQLKSNSVVMRFVKKCMKLSYLKTDKIAHLGSCMKLRLKSYDIPDEKLFELTPWAINEPSKIEKADTEEREKLFGNAEIGVLYSGNIGKAHEIQLLIEFIRKLRHKTNIKFCFSLNTQSRKSVEELLKPEDININFCDMVEIGELPRRLSAADVHITSLKEGWEGIAVPSKYFGSLSVGRPTLFVGSRESSIAAWNIIYDVGWNLNHSNLDEVSRIFEHENFKKIVTTKHKKCFDTYHSHFSRKVIADRSNSILNAEIEQ